MLKLYSKPELGSECVQVSGPQAYMLTKSDGSHWVWLENYYGNSGWIFVDKDDDGQPVINGELSREDFAGYSNVP